MIIAQDKIQILQENNDQRFKYPAGQFGMAC